jgi:pyruvate kinase
MLELEQKRRTKILATVGPASSSYDQLLELVKAGVTVFRLNFSHGTHAEHYESIQRISYINDKFGLYIGILADLQGPKLRVGEIENGGFEVAEGDVITLVNRKCVGTQEAIYMSYEQFPMDVEAGERVLVDDGKLVFEVIETNKQDIVRLKTIFGGMLKSRKGVNLPNTKVSLPCLTEKDLADLEFILTQPVNWIALSFVRSHEDLVDLKKRIAERGHPARVIAKIEKPEAIQNIDSVIKEAQGVMVARGDLGIEIPIEQLPLIQKHIVKLSLKYARPVIVATQMLESMTSNLVPTRAEVTDVANAVLDGADCLMLSGETSTGVHPAKVVQQMARIIREVEKDIDFKDKRPQHNPRSATFHSDVVCFSAAAMAEQIEAKAIIGMTSSGYTAFRLSSYRPRTDIIIFSDRIHMLSTLNLVWGVKCYYADRFTTTDAAIREANQYLLDNGQVRKGDFVVNTGSMPLNRRYKTNMLKVSKIE